MSQRGETTANSLYDLFIDESFRYNKLPISDLAWIDLNRLMQLVPLSLTHFWGYEIPLSREDLVADFLFCIHDRERFYAFMSESNKTDLFPGPYFNRFKSLAAKWNNLSDPISDALTNLWFEYDYQDIQLTHFNPNFFFAPNQSLNFLEIVNISYKIFGELKEETPEKDQYALLLKCYEALPGTSWISQIGMMLARNNATTLRIFIQDIPNKGILNILENLNYAYLNDVALQQALHLAYQSSDQVNLNLDIGKTVGAKLGIECYFNTMETALGFLGKIYECGVCTEQKFHLMKSCLEKMHLNQNSDYQEFLSHFKIVYTPGYPLDLKAYTGFVHTNIARSVIRTKPLIKSSYEKVV